MQPVATAVTDAEIAELDELLAHLPAPLQPLDVSALDGYLCGVLLQPVTILVQDWLPPVFDLGGATPPAGAASERIAALAQRRLSELGRSIAARQWFDPWIFEPDDPQASPVRAQLPWVAGFAEAMSRFPAVAQCNDPSLREPLAVLYAPFDPQDLEDAQDLLPIIETLAPPATMAEAAEDLVRSVLLLADVTRPRGSTPRPPDDARRGAKKRRKRPPNPAS